VYLVIFAILFQASGPISHHESPLRETMTLAISTDRGSYYVWESVRVTATLENQGTEAIAGQFCLDIDSGLLELYYRRASGRFVKFENPPPTGDYGIAVRTLAPHGGSTSWDTVLAFNWAQRGFVLDQPGEYEVKVVYHDIPNDPDSSLISETKAFTVLAPPTNESAAAAEYSPSLALMTQGVPPPLFGYDGKGIHRLIGEGKTFIEHYPQSAYAAPVRKELQRHLAVLIGRGEVTAAEKALYEDLFDRWKATHAARSLESRTRFGAPALPFASEAACGQGDSHFSAP
jgi:hypothetical protein